MPSTPADDHRLLPESSAPAPSYPLRVLVIGDSTAVSLGAGLVEHAADEGSDLQVRVDADGACGIVRGGEYQLDVLNASLKMSCPTIIWERALADVTALNPDVVVVNITLADTWDRSWDEGRTWLTPTDSEFEKRISDDYAMFVDSLIAAGAEKIVWLRPPISYTDGQQSEVEPSFSNGGQAVIEAAVDELAARHPGILETIDYAAWFETTPTGRDRASRPDGIHMTQRAAIEAARWLTPRLQNLLES
jgi:lysophospholipase L1-like esterase